MWLKVDGFKDLKRNWWVCYDVKALFNHSLALKLKALKQDLKGWNKEVFGNVFSNKIVTLNQTRFWDAKKREAILSMEEVEARREVKKEFSKWATFK